MSTSDGSLLVVEPVPEAFSGERVDRAVSLLAGVSRSRAARLVDEGRVRVDGEIVGSRSQRLEAGQRLEVDVPAPANGRPSPDPSIPVEVVHVDEHLIVVDKPAGLVVHPGAGHDTGTLVHGLVHRFPDIADVGEAHRPGLVHRLDRGTSGLLVVARTPAAHRHLVDAFSRREVHRTYVALVWGRVEADAGTIEAPIGRSHRHRTRMTVTSSGRDAVTHYRVLGRTTRPAAMSLLRCELDTGRTHQIRVHLRAIGHPVVGDRDYDGGRPGPDPGRPFLHAAVLRFPHPSGGEPLTTTSPLPDDLVAVLDACGLDVPAPDDLV